MTPEQIEQLTEEMFFDGHHHPSLVRRLSPLVERWIAEARADERRHTDHWRELAELRDDLLVCYRVGKQPSDRLLDRLSFLREHGPPRDEAVRLEHSEQHQDEPEHSEDAHG